MATQKIKNASSYSEGSAVVAVTRLGSYQKIAPSVSPNIRGSSAYAYNEDGEQFAIISATSASPIVVAAVPGRRIRVLGYVFTTTTTQGVKWQSNTTNISGNMTLDVNGGISSKNETGLVETATGEALRLLPDGAGTINGHIIYVVR